MTIRTRSGRRTGAIAVALLALGGSSSIATAQEPTVTTSSSTTSPTTTTSSTTTSTPINQPYPIVASVVPGVLTSTQDCRGTNFSDVWSPGSVTFTRATPATEASTLPLTWTGFAAFVADLPDAVTFPAGSTTQTVEVGIEGYEIDTAEPAPKVTVTFDANGGTGASLPHTVTMDFAANVIGDLACNLLNRWIEVSTEIGVGDVPEPLDLASLASGGLEEPELVLDGALPAGLAVDAQGRFTGAATTAGTTVTDGYLCEADSGFCAAKVHLTIVVVPERDMPESTWRPPTTSAAPAKAATAVRAAATYTG